MQTDTDWMCLNYLCVNLVGPLQFSQVPWKRSQDWKLAGNFSCYPYWESVFSGGETTADLKCEGKKPSGSDKLTVDVLGVNRMSIQSFSKLIIIEPKSDDLHAVKKSGDGFKAEKSVSIGLQWVDIKSVWFFSRYWHFSPTFDWNKPISHRSRWIKLTDFQPPLDQHVTVVTGR